MNLNNNTGDSLVVEFLNIWSDLRKFNGAESLSSDIGSTLSFTKTISRNDRLIDPRDIQANLFAQYSGTYQVKCRQKVMNSEPRKETTPTRRPRLRRRNRDRKVEKKDVTVFPVISRALNVCNESTTAEKDSPKNEDIFCSEESNSELDLHDDLEATQHTRSLLSFLKSVHILPVLEEEESEGPSMSIDGVVENKNSSNAMTIPLMDDNNNFVQSPVIIDVTSDSSDSSSEEEHDGNFRNENRWLEVIEEDHINTSLQMRDYKHPLENDWTFWYFYHQEDKTWSQSLEALVTVSTIEDFWSVIHWVESPSSIKVGADFSMFKRGILPDWSDEGNQRGGRYIVRCHKEEVDTMWTELMMALIGQYFVDPENDEKINGSVVSVRRKEDRIAIWVRNISDRYLAEQSTMAVLGRKGEFSIHKH